MDFTRYNFFSASAQEEKAKRGGEGLFPGFLESEGRLSFCILTSVPRGKQAHVQLRSEMELRNLELGLGLGGGGQIRGIKKRAENIVGCVWGG